MDFALYMQRLAPQPIRRVKYLANLIVHNSHCPLVVSLCAKVIMLGLLCPCCTTSGWITVVGASTNNSDRKENLVLLPMTLGDAFENAAVGYSSIKASLKNQRLASNEDDTVDDDFVPVFGIKMLVKSEEDGSIMTGLTDRLYFNGEQAQQVLKQVIEQEGDSEELKYEIFVVSLVKAIEYMILDNESDFKFEFVPPESSLNYLTSNYNV